jgi:hypothetical protein
METGQLDNHGLLPGLLPEGLLHRRLGLPVLEVRGPTRPRLPHAALASVLALRSPSPFRCPSRRAAPTFCTVPRDTHTIATRLRASA